MNAPPSFSSDKYRFPKKRLNILLYQLKSRRYPLSLIYSGSGNWSNGTNNDQGVIGRWWDDKAYNTSNAGYLRVVNTQLNSVRSTVKTGSIPLRSYFS